MNSRVLVLNQDFSPLMVCSIERAFVLVFLNKSELVKPFHNHRVNSITRSYPMPSVIRLNRYIHAPYKIISLTRQNIFRRDRFECQYCGTKKDLTLDHVLPSSRGGGQSWTNLVTACKRCNARKGDFTPEEAGMPLKRKPFKPSHAIFLKEYVHNHEGLWDEFLS
ncbi:MAG: HNH endonuclease [Bacteroidota bacterium]